MNKPIKTISTVIGTISLSLLGITPTFAEGCSDLDGAPEEVRRAAGCSGNTNALPTIITGILNAIIAASGLVAVVYIIVGGVNYMTSSGDAGKVEKAKKTILYACIGLVVCVLAFAIVNFVIKNIIGGQK